MKNLNPEKVKIKRLEQAERFVKGTPLSAQQWLDMIDEPNLNDLPPEQVLLRLSLLDCLFKLYPKDPIDMRLKVYYGFARLTKKIVKKPALVVFYENGKSLKNEKWVKQKMFVVYERFQTEKESSQAHLKNRMFTKYEYFINEKPWNGNIEGILHDNYVSEIPDIPEQECLKIRESLKNSVYRFYGLKIPKTYQSSFNF